MSNKAIHKVICIAIIIVIVAGLATLFNQALKYGTFSFPKYTETKISQEMINRADPFSDRVWQIRTDLHVYTDNGWEDLDTWKGYIFENEIAAEKKRQRELAEAKAKEVRQLLLTWRESK